MFKDTCLIALKRKAQSPRMFGPEILIYLILKSLFDDSRTNSPNAQAHNHTNAIIICMGIASRDRGCDSENFGIRIT
jgi:hypothetical protein